MTTQSPPVPDTDRGSRPVALLRITLGVIILATWWDNIVNDLYTSDGLTGLINWLFTPEADGGNGSSLTFYQTILDNIVVPIAGVVAVGQLVVEGAIGVALLLGAATRLAAFGAMLFFGQLFLGFFGGAEWIWTYVLLFMASLTVFLGWGGRRLGVDEWLGRTRGESPLTLVW